MDNTENMENGENRENMARLTQQSDEELIHRRSRMFFCYLIHKHLVSRFQFTNYLLLVD